MWRKVMPRIGYDYTPYMDYMDLAVQCLRKAVKLNRSISASYRPYFPYFVPRQHFNSYIRHHCHHCLIKRFAACSPSRHYLNHISFYCTLSKWNSRSTTKLFIEKKTFENVSEMLVILSQGQELWLCLELKLHKMCGVGAMVRWYIAELVWYHAYC